MSPLVWEEIETATQQWKNYDIYFIYDIMEYNFSGFRWIGRRHDSQVRRQHTQGIRNVHFYHRVFHFFLFNLERFDSRWIFHYGHIFSHFGHFYVWKFIFVCCFIKHKKQTSKSMTNSLTSFFENNWS
jgi:hypothetical protein